MKSLTRCATALLLACAATATAEEETLYLEVLQETMTEPTQGQAEGEREAPKLLLAVGEQATAAPIAAWCDSQRDTAPPSALPEALLRGADYDRFATGLVPLSVEILIDDVELRYAMGTLRPTGASGLEFPFFELCAFGFGRKQAEDWALDVIHLSNHRGDQLAIGLYKGVLPEVERAFLEEHLGYPLDEPDPAGVLAMGSEFNVETLLLATSPDGEAFERLRRRIIR